MRGLPSCWKIFGGRAHCIASLPLIELVRNISMMNPSLDPACAGGGAHDVADLAGHVRGVHLWGC